MDARCRAFVPVSRLLEKLAVKGGALPCFLRVYDRVVTSASRPPSVHRFGGHVSRAVPRARRFASLLTASSAALA